MSLLDEIVGRLNGLPEDKRKEIYEQAAKATAHMPWLPNPGPQHRALDSEADELFYGGSAGCGKSSLLVGLAVTYHHRSILFRREFPQIKGLVDEAVRILGSRDGYNAQEKVWRLPGGDRELEFGSVQHEEDKEKYQGRPHDLIGFDEICHFSETQYRFLIGWNRSAKQGQRSRVVCAGNPPLNSEGAWVIKYWGPWLDPQHPNPAEQGELRWFTTINGEDVEVDGPGPHQIDGREVMARSRTFIGGVLEDNPDLMNSGYAATLEAMPEPMRTMLRTGRFDVAAEDHEWQVIPTQWVLDAQARWKPDGKDGLAMTALSVDIAQGGIDKTTLAPRYGGWYDNLVSKPGKETPDGSSVAGLVIRHRRDACPVIVDMGGGYGGDTYSRLKDNGIEAHRYNGANASTGKTRDGSNLAFVNKRSETHWRFREALSPEGEFAGQVALPPDAELRADLCAPRWKLTPRGILIESKEDIKKRIGRSPDKGDAVVNCLEEGNAAVKKRAKSWVDRPTRANTGFAAQKQMYRR